MGLKGRTVTQHQTIPEPRHFRELLVNSAAPAQAAARALRGAVRTALPAAAESLHGGRKPTALYHVSGRLVCGIEPSAAVTLLHVHGIGAADAPAGLKLGGRGPGARFIRFDTVNAVRDRADAIRTLLLRAATTRR